MHLRRFVLLLLFAVIAAQAAPELDPNDLPRVPPTEPSQAVNTFRIKPGLRLELAAAEPLVLDPIALSFDEDGRLYVVEMRDYSERRDERLGRIRLLEDTNGDGHFDSSSVFADDLPWPTAVFCYGGGVFVGSTPDILYLKDTTGDRVADERQVVFTGFGTSRDRLNVQALLNCFNWGLDNRIHGLTAPNGGKVVPAGDPSATPLDLTSRNFRFDPRTLEIQPETGGGQYGMSFDDRGRKYATSNSRHLMMFMYDDRYAARNPHHAMPPGIIDIAVDGPAAEVFRISPDEPWRVIRTKWRVEGVVPGIVEGGGRVSGYFTGASGGTIYRGNALPPEFSNNAFVADSGGNLVHRKLLSPDGVAMKAERPVDEQNVEFLASSDIWFRPVLFANGPDGALYVIDMYREVIEHPWSLPEPIKKHLDLNSGNDRGRIYRVIPEDFKRPKPPRLGQAGVRELVATLEHPNGWHRETAARLIYERQNKAAIPLLKRMVAGSKSPPGRLHALYALDGLSALAESNVVARLADSDGAVREHAVLLAEKFLPESLPSPRLWDALKALTDDPDPRVRHQLAFTLGETRHPERIQALAEMVRRNPGDSWLAAAALSSLREGAMEMLPLSGGDAAFRGSTGGRDFLRQLALLIGAKNEPDEVARVFEFLEEFPDPELIFPLARGLGEGLQRAKSSLAAADRKGSLETLASRAAVIAANAGAGEPARIEAIQFVGLRGFSESGELLLSLLNSREPQEIQLAALKMLTRFQEDRIGAELIDRWHSFSPRVRSEAMGALLARTERTQRLLAAIEHGLIRQAELNSTQISLLEGHRELKIRQQARRILSIAPSVQRREVVDAFQPALTLAGHASRGKAIYEERCASCHRFAGQGSVLGPDIETVMATGKEKLLLNIIDPNGEVAPNYLAYLIETNDDEIYTGILAGETPNSVTLRQAFGNEETILRANIRRLQSLGQSIMPEELEAGLSVQEMADLLEYIVSGGK